MSPNRQLQEPCRQKVKPQYSGLLSILSHFRAKMHVALAFISACLVLILASKTILELKTQLITRLTSATVGSLGSKASASPPAYCLQLLCQVCLTAPPQKQGRCCQSSAHHHPALRAAWTGLLDNGWGDFATDNISSMQRMSLQAAPAPITHLCWMLPKGTGCSSHSLAGCFGEQGAVHGVHTRYLCSRSWCLVFSPLTNSPSANRSDGAPGGASSQRDAQLRHSPRPCAQRLPRPTAQTWASPALTPMKTWQLQGHQHICSGRTQGWKAKHRKTGVSKGEGEKGKRTDLWDSAIVEISDKLKMWSFFNYFQSNKLCN